MGNKNTIEFNGKVYDALTGKLLKSSSSNSDKASPATASNKKAKPKITSPKRPPAKQHQGHRPDRSRTLMRSSVKKPAAAKRPINQVNTPANSKPAKHVTSEPLASRLAISERRLVKAKQTGKSSAISRFRTGGSKFIGKVEPVPLKSSPPKSAVKTAKVSSSQKLDDLLTTGLAKANSHEQSAPTTKSKSYAWLLKCKWPLIVGLILIVLLIGGSLLTHFATSFEFNIATDRSGVHITLPSYTPAGFKLVEPINYANGTITINYVNKSTGQKYNIVAQNSDWDSPTLVDSFVLNADTNYQTLQRAGRTLFIYQQSNVTWVNGGVWYRLRASSGIPISQLAAIASSM